MDQNTRNEKLRREFAMMRTIKMKSLFLSMIAALITFTIAIDALATEGGGGAYLNGSEDFMTGALAPPGTYMKNYLVYLRETKFKDDSGKDAPIPGFRMDGFIEALRVLHVTDKTILGATWGYQVVGEVVRLKLDSDIPGYNDDNTGLGDVMISAMLLTWHINKNLHVTISPTDVYFPIGSYNKNRLVNPGRHYWTFEPAAAFTYLSDFGLEVTAKFMYDFNLKNQATEYTSGQEFHVDYAAGYHYKDLIIGASGFYYQQTTKDEQFGNDINHFKGTAFGLGPAVSYTYKNMNLILKWQKEFEVKNKPEGDRVFLNFSYAF